MRKLADPFMALAIREAKTGMRLNHGGPFGAVITRGGRVIAKAHNQVLKNNDPTAHAEVQALRKAARRLRRHDLSDCEIYTTCEPCPMCFSALFWARISRIVYGCSRYDAAKIGFDDELIYQILNGQTRQKQMEVLSLDRERCLDLFSQWQEKSDRQMY